MFSKRIRKAIAAFFLLLIVQSVVVPSLSYALTAGPTAPEATSFEPVDTTDLVDLKTGDFTYNIPLLEVPGPAGSYPLNLSYHAGIQPNQEASWTGLGFTLNPGSVSRLVNGYPDDHNGAMNVDRTFWEGGETESYTVGLSVGIANSATVSAGLTFAQDTYKGFGLGQYIGMGIGLNDYVGINFQTGSSPYGGGYTSAGIKLGVGTGAQEGMNLGADVGLSINSASGINASAGGGVSYSAGTNSEGQSIKASLLEATISTEGSSSSLSIGGGTSGVYNSRSNRVSANGDNFQIDIPIYYGVNLRLARDYQRYWIDESESVHTFGSLYLGDAQPGFTTAFDTYDLLDTEIDMALHNNSEKVLGGSFPDYDFFTVTAQGLAGNIRPYHFQKHLFRQDRRDAADNNRVLSKSYLLNNSASDNPVEFRFINDFSNRYEYTPQPFDFTSDEVTFDFNNAVTTGKNGNEGYINNHLAGSKHIEWHTNHEILHGTTNLGPLREGFIDCIAEGFVREDNTQIGGFSMTNASGVTYHYALPAYSFNEYMKSTNSETKQIQNGLSYNELKKPEKYAYTWFLTAVTGPDFVDRNSNGQADHGDWGYWVNFEYKKWLSNYQWRNPGEGVNRDIDGDFEFFSSGKKEIYYLEKIFTESHVAVFEKSERLDGREVVSLANGGFDPISFVKTPGKQQCVSACEQQNCSQANCNEPGFSNCLQNCQSLPDDEIDYIIPRPSLKLDKIKLYSYNSYISGVRDEQLLRAISFAYDYTLAMGTPNSFDNTDFSKQGKLTLKGINYLGKKGVSLIPPMTFGYKNAPYEKDKADVWGFFKNDYDESFRNETNDIVGRSTTSVSALDVDVWSLDSISTSLGTSIQIDYESDQYNDVALARQQILRTKDVTDHGQNKLKLTFWENLNLDDYFGEGENIEVDLIGSYNNNEFDSKTCNCNEITPTIYSPQLFSGSVVVEEVNSQLGFIVVSNPDYYNKIKNETKIIKRVHIGTNLCEDEIVTCEFTYSGTNAWPDFFPAGSVSISERERFGGGLRVKSITLDNPSGQSRSTTYEYENGSTSFEPFEILAPKILPAYDQLGDAPGTKLFYKQALLKKLYKQIGISRALPGPGVMYGQVTVREQNITPDGQPHLLPNYATYEFELFSEGMVDVVHEPVANEPIQGTRDNVTFNNAYLNKVALKDFTSRVGSLKTISLFDTENEALISKTVNHYLHDNLSGSFNDNINLYEQTLLPQFSNQGVIEETYSRARIMLYKKLEDKPYFLNAEIDFFENNERSLLATISKLESFPSIPTGQTNINYKTGIVSSTQNLSFDFYSGELTSSSTKDSYGNRYLNVSTPAYEKYPEMGSKIYNKQNKNMLTQTTANESYRIDEQNVKIGLLTASVQTWTKTLPLLNVSNDAPDIWRKKSSYQWSGGLQDLNKDGSFKISDFDTHPFNWESENQDNAWDKAGEITLTDIYSHALEAKDINGNFAATRMDKSQQRVIASASNASYNEIAYSGAEYSAGNTEKEGGVDRGQGIPATAFTHTGAFSLQVSRAAEGYNYTLSSTSANLAKKYRASVWVYAPGLAETQSELNKVELYYRVNGVETKVHPTLQKNKSKSWYLLNIDINPAGSGEVYVGVRNNAQREVYFDDFRVHPLKAAFSSFVYDNTTGELSYILDGNNFYTKFEYDAMGRLIRSKKELLNFDFGEGKESFRADAILKEFKYNYGKN